METQALVASDMPPASEIVDPHILSFFWELVDDLGGSPDELLRLAGVDPVAFRTGAHTPTYRQTVDLLDLGATRLGAPDFGMQLAKRQAGHIRSPLVTLMQSCKTVGEAIRQASARSYAHSPAAAIWMEVADSDDQFAIGHDILLDGLPHRAQAMEQILLIAWLSISEISGGRARARKVQFRHQRISSPSTYRRYFGCDVSFGARDDVLVFDKHVLAYPTMKHDEAALEAAIAHIEAERFERKTFPTDVRAAVMHRLGTAECTASQVAANLNLHCRTMHRKLAAEGTSFQRIKNEVRRDLALFLLENTAFPLSRISERLGFAEQSTLSHFCRKWFGEAPSALRAREPDGAAPVRNEQV